MEVGTCACGAPATSGSSRSECPSCFRRRLRSITIDASATPTRTRSNYFDAAALDETFGDDRVDRYWDETDGMGALVRDDKGRLVHTDHHGETKVASEDVIESFLGPETEDVT